VDDFDWDVTAGRQAHHGRQSRPRVEEKAITPAAGAMADLIYIA
jgi:hypothetical protein